MSARLAKAVAAQTPLIRKGFVMHVDPKQHDEYKRRHDQLWPDLREELERAGVHRYSIMLHPGTSQLFAFVEFDDEAKWDAIAKTEACQRWWRFMGDIMPSNADHSPVAEQLCEVFYMEGPGSDERA